MTLELWINTPDFKKYEITSIVGDISLRSSLGNISDVLMFDIQYNNQDPEFPVNPCELGSIVQLITDSGEIFKGVVIDEEKQDYISAKYRAVDLAFYMTRSSFIFQFNKIPADAAIKKVLEKYNISINSIASMKTVINQIYINKTGADVIDDILSKVFEESGKEYHYRMIEGKFFLGEMTENVGKLTFRQDDDIIVEMDSIEAASAISRKRSIDGLKNSIAIYFVETAKNGKKYPQKCVVEDLISIEKYGLFQEQLEGGEYSKNIKKRKRNKTPQKTLARAMKHLPEAKNKAENMLRKLNRVFEEVTFTTFGNDKAVAGKLLDFSDEFTGANGEYLISEATHNWRHDGYMMTLNLSMKLD